MKLTDDQIKDSGIEVEKSVEIHEAYAFVSVAEAVGFITKMFLDCSGSIYAQKYYSSGYWVVVTYKSKPGDEKRAAPVFYAEQNHLNTVAPSGLYGTAQQ